MLILVPLYSTAVFFARIVIPRSFSMAFESIARSCNCVLAFNVCDCFNSSSTRVVFPWSTWAIIATFRISFLYFNVIAPLILALTQRVIIPEKKGET